MVDSAGNRRMREAVPCAFAFPPPLRSSLRVPPGQQRQGRRDDAMTRRRETEGHMTTGDTASLPRSATRRDCSSSRLLVVPSSFVSSCLRVRPFPDRVPRYSVIRTVAVKSPSRHCGTATATPLRRTDLIARSVPIARPFPKACTRHTSISERDRHPRSAFFRHWRMVRPVVRLKRMPR